MRASALDQARSKLTQCLPLTDDELELLHASRPGISAEDISADADLVSEEERAFLRGDTLADPLVAR